MHGLQWPINFEELLEQGEDLIVGCEELVELKQMAQKLAEWRENVQLHLESKQPDRITVLEQLLVEAGEIRVDLSGSELMQQLQESLKTCALHSRVATKLIGHA